MRRESLGLICAVVAVAFLSAAVVQALRDAAGGELREYGFYLLVAGPAFPFAWGAVACSVLARRRKS